MPKVVNAVKGAVKATGSAVKGAAKTAVKGAIAGTAKAASVAKKAVSGVKRMTAVAAAAVPICVNKAGKVAKKAVAAVSTCVDATIKTGKAAGKMVGDYLKYELGERKKRFDEHNQNLGKRVAEEWENYWRKIERGITEKGVFYSPVKGISDTLDFMLQLRKAVVEEYPTLNWTERKLQGAYQWVKDGVITNGDKFGNYIYNKNWGVVSNFVGGFFNASDMKENSGVAASVGSFFNGVIGHGILGTVDGIVTAVTNPYGTVEGINNIVGDPGTAFSALKKEVGRVWDEEIINGSWEDRSRVAGAVTFEVVTTVGGAVKAGKAAKAGDKAADLGTAAKAAGVMDDATGVAAKTAGVMDDAAGVAAKAAGVMDDATGMAAKAADIMGDAAVTAQTAKKTGKLGSAIDRALTSNLVKKAANKADDFVREIRKLLNPPELKPALASGALDDAGEVGFFTKHYNNRVEKNTPLQSNSGVNIQKAEIVGDAVDGTGDLGGVVKKGGSETVKDGAYRASKYSKSWKKGSLKDAINKFAPDSIPEYTDKGKIIYRNSDTGIEIVYDKNGNYFRINDTNITGRRSYIDLEGNKIPNNVVTEKGTQRGITQGEYNELTHFNNTD